MTIGLTIPGVETVHPREEVFVDPCYPITGPAQNIRNVRQMVAHYSAAANTPDGDLGEFGGQIPPWLRAVNKDYWTNRIAGVPKIICGRTLTGYAVGYLFAVDWLGGAWELRGFDYKAAANAPTNDWTFPILFITDGASPASELALQTARAIGREARRRSGRDDFAPAFTPHYRLPGAATACCGAGIIGQIDRGLLDLDLDEGDIMGALNAIPSVRAYDSRGLPIDDEFVESNGGLPKSPMQPGDVRRVVVGLASQATVNITAIGKGQQGYIAVSADGVLPKTSAVNYDAADILEANSWTTPLTGGALYLHCSNAPADVLVDVTARG